jgi:DNA-binding GntR family transcriptional regulator
MAERSLSRPPSRQTARDVVADYLRKEILKGHLAPGERLAVAELAEVLGVSQTPVREALQQLTGDALVEMSAFRGAHVARLSPDEFEETFLMRVPSRHSPQSSGPSASTRPASRRWSAPWRPWPRRASDPT